MRKRFGLGAVCIGLLTTTMGTASCASASEDRTTLAAAASYTQVEIVYGDGRLHVTLQTTRSSCLQVNATATFGGMPMKVEDQGHATTGTGTSVGEVKTSCSPPSFSLVGPFDLPGPVTLSIADASRTYEVVLPGGLPRRTFTVTKPADGKLHVGKSATLSLLLAGGTLTDVAGVSMGATAVDCADAAGNYLFDARAETIPGRTPTLLVSNRDFTFDVPAHVTPPPVQMRLGWHLTLPVDACTGPMQCSAREDHAPAGSASGPFQADPYAGPAPLTIEP